MALEPGTTLGVYEVVSAIGAGGMGEVYKTRDTKLDRDVALKVLPQAFSDDPDRLGLMIIELIEMNSGDTQ
jgi:serine/threonine protein kinase